MAKTTKERVEEALDLAMSECADETTDFLAKWLLRLEYEDMRAAERAAEPPATVDPHRPGGNAR